MAVKNVSTISQTFYSARVAVCSSSEATVVPVYDSSNNAYNAFKFTASGTDYYYVLDGTQTDWTNDLSSIGYSLTPAAFTAWPNSANNQQSLPMVGSGIVYTYILFDADGHWLPTTQNYILTGYHETVDGPLLSVENTGLYLLRDTMYGRMKITSNGSVSGIHVQRIEYTAS
jgi:hypothetical protein